MPRPYRMLLYPLPLIVAGAGWLAVFWTSEDKRWYALGSLLVGGLCYLVWSFVTGRWPWSAEAAASSPQR